MADLLSVERVTSPDGNSDEDEVMLSVNGVKLIDLVTAAGVRADEDKSWVYPPARLLRTDHFLPGPDRWEVPTCGEVSFFPGDQTALLADACGMPGCDAVLVVTVAVEDDIVWRGFCWYSPDRVLRLGNFAFDRQQYEAALNAVTR